VRVHPAGLSRAVRFTLQWFNKEFAKHGYPISLPLKSETFASARTPFASMSFAALSDGVFLVAERSAAKAALVGSYYGKLIE
jgi:hypothetical protein